MLKLSLTTFVDIVSLSGTHKATETRKALNQDDYHPSKDYYRQVREGIIDLHEQDKPKLELENILKSLSHENRRGNYIEIISSYLKWIGKKKLEWFQPPYSTYGNDQVDIRVNPELGLNINGSDHIVKLYFKSDKLTKAKADIIMGVMQECFGSENIMSVLDIRRSKLFVPTKKIPMLKQTVDAEIAYVAQFLST